MKLALGVSYCGRHYYGWQRQSHTHNTVQHYIELALSTVADETVNVCCAGRTDSGVHASGQVIHFSTNALRDLRGWKMGTNTQLPKDIRIHWVRAVADDFHARFSAKYRRYHYIIEDNSSGNAIFNGLVTPCRYALDAEAMQQAAQVLVGEHDFSSFRAAQCQSQTPNRHVDFIRVYRNGQFVIIDIQANAFLYHMVRNIVGSLLLIGQGKKEVAWLNKVLQERNRCLAGTTAGANGLYLVEVGYDSVYNIPAGNHPLPFI
ncbi:MAG: tRNA pseudouridine(38-40) synthase TruA [Gammaproteobacteria bacterium]|nr:MAG: tRNA pseudouridine(38-40) synthase TruA [Gammaproteobacteria bacterium]